MDIDLWVAGGYRWVDRGYDILRANAPTRFEEYGLGLIRVTHCGHDVCSHFFVWCLNCDCEFQFVGSWRVCGGYGWV